MDLVEVLGKKNRKVPVLLTRDMTAAIETLISTREAVGIPTLNPYVFAQVQMLNLLDLFFKDLITKLLKEKRDITA